MKDAINVESTIAEDRSRWVRENEWLWHVKPPEVVEREHGFILLSRKWREMECSRF